MMLSAASTSNQHQPNFWFPSSPLPSFFSTSSAGGGNDRNHYQPQAPAANKVIFDTSACSSSSGGSPPPAPLSNDYLVSRPHPSNATTLNLTQFNYIQQSHHHHHHNHPSSNHFLPRDDWSQIPMVPSSTNAPSPSAAVWHSQHTASKGKGILSRLHQTH